MKGEIFSLFEKFIVKNFGGPLFEEAYLKALPELKMKEPFVGPEVYLDSDFMTLFKHTLELTKLPTNKALRLFGRYAFKGLAGTITELMQRYSRSLDLLRELDSIIHVEVRKLNRGTEPPRFTLIEHADRRIELIYDSPRKLHHLAEGLIEGLADYFGEQVQIERQPHNNGKVSFWLSYHDK